MDRVLLRTGVLRDTPDWWFLQPLITRLGNSFLHPCEQQCLCQRKEEGEMTAQVPWSCNEMRTDGVGAWPREIFPACVPVMSSFRH